MAITEFDSDAALTFLKELGRQLDEVKAKAADMGITGGGGMRRAGEEMERFGARAKYAFSIAKEMDIVVGSMAKNFLGPLGLVAGIVGAAKALDSFAVSQLQLRNFATDVGLSTRQVADMRTMARGLGMDASEATSQLSGVAGKIKDVMIHGTTSEFWRSIRNSNQALADRIMTLSREGDEWNALRAIVDSYWANEGNRPYQMYLEQQTGVTRSWFESQKEGLKGLTQEWIPPTKAAEDYHREMTNLGTTLGNLFAKLSTGAMILSLPDTETRRRLLREMFPELGDWPGLRTEEEKQKAQEEHERNRQRQNRRGGLPVGQPPNMLPQSYTPEGEVGAPHFMRAAYTVAASRDLTEIESDSNKLLNDIRDSLQRMEAMSASGGEGPGATVFRPGRRIPGVSAVPGGPTLGSTGANYMIGPPPGPGDLTTVQTKAGPITVNKAAAEDISGFVNDLIEAGAPPEEIGSYVRKYIAGSGRLSQHAYGTAIDYGQQSRNVVARDFAEWANRNRDKLAEIMRRRHMISGGDWRNPDFGHFEWNPRATYTDPSQARASVFNDPRVAGERLGYSPWEPGIALPNAGTLGQRFIVTDPKTGKSAVLPQIDIGPSAWTGRGLDLNKAAAGMFGYGLGNFPTDQGQWKIEPYMDKIDRSLRQQNKWDMGTASIDVDFKNVPRGVSTSADVEGSVFKTLKVSRSPQAALAGGGVGEFNRWAYE